MSSIVPPSTDTGSAPGSVRAVVWLVVAQLVFNMCVGLPLAYLSKDAALAALPTTPGVDKEAIWQGSFGFTVLASLGMGLLWVLFAVKLRQGRSWARVTLLVFAVLAVVFTPINLLNGVAIPQTVVPALIGMAVGVLLIVLLVTESTKSWVRQGR